MLPIRILLVDDSPEFLESAARFLSADSQIEIVGRALSGAEAMAQVARIHPDLVLMDWGMPGMSGLEATHHLKVRPDAPSIVILTVYDDAEYRAAARAMGADGYVAKSEIGTELLPAIHTLFDELTPVVGRACLISPTKTREDVSDR
jgi:DNA-binding NarL/FixJ family response regulator